MKLSIKRDALQQAFSLAQNAVATSTTMPILECVLLNACRESNSITLTGNNMENLIQTCEIPATVKEAGSIAVDAKLLSNILNKISHDTVTMDVDVNGKCIVKSGKAKFNIQSQNADEFPIVEELEGKKGTPFEINQRELKSAITGTIFSVSSDGTNLPLTGVFFEFELETLTLVAIDGFRISKRSIACSFAQDAPLYSVIIPANAIGCLQRMLSNDDKSVVIEIDDKHVSFVTDEFTLYTRVINGNFIDYKSKVNIQTTTDVIIDRKEFLSVIERTCIVAVAKDKTPVIFDIGTDAMTVMSVSPTDMRHEEEISAEITGNPVRLSFNPRYIHDVLKVINDDTITLRLSSPLTPCIIKSDDESYLYLILPLRTTR